MLALSVISLTTATGSSVVLCQITVANALHICHFDFITTFSIKEIPSRKCVIKLQEALVGCIVPEYA